MSRSRKKTSVISDYSRGPSGTKLDKRLASKKVRRYGRYIPNGCAYKKLFCSYNIFDYKWRLELGGSWYVRGKRK